MQRSLAMRLLSWIILVPVAIVIVAFSVSNRAPVALDFWPLPLSVETPLFMVVLTGLVIGLVCGAFVCWASMGKVRRRARLSSRQAKTAERELDRLREKARTAEADDGRGVRPLANTLPAPVSSDAA